MQNRGVIKLGGYNLISGILIVLMNALPVIYLGWFAKRFHGLPETVLKPDQELAASFEKYGISPRESDIIRLIAEGKTNREISDELFISLQTVKDHVHRIFRKTGVKNRVQLTNLFQYSKDQSQR
jgi:DNA-binding CsgD family transcriptional regulator